MATTSIWRVTIPKQVKKTIDYVTQEKKTVKQELMTSDEIKLTDNRYAIENVINYAMKEEKTETENKDKYVTAINCTEMCAYEEMLAVKKQFSKEDGTLLYHGYQSFQEGELTADVCHEIGVKTAQKVWGDKYQVVVTTHMDTDNLHNHFVINTVSFVDGKKYCRTNKDYQFFKRTSDELCIEYNLSVVRKTSPTNDIKVNKSINKRDIARKIVSDALNKSKNLLELKRNLSLVGCESNFSLNRKYFTITPYGYDKAIRLYRLGEMFTNKAIIERLEANSKSKDFEEPLQHTSQNDIQDTKNYLLVLSNNHKKKKGGLQGLYLYYCYLLGILPKGTKKNVHPIFLGDLKDFDRIYNDLKMLFNKDIFTSEELVACKNEDNKRIQELTATRKILYNNVSRNIDGYKKDRVKEEIKDIGEELKSLRKNIKSYDRVLYNSEQINKKIDDYEKLDDKEKVQYEERKIDKDKGDR